MGKKKNDNQLDQTPPEPFSNTKKSDTVQTTSNTNLSQDEDSTVPEEKKFKQRELMPSPGILPPECYGYVYKPQPGYPVNFSYSNPYPELGSKPTAAKCPICQFDVITVAKSKPSTKTHLCGSLSFFFIGPFCFCMYLLHVFANTYHYCPQCRALIGIYYR